MRFAGGVGLVLVGYATSARADDAPINLREGTLTDPSDEPLLELDPIWRSNFEFDGPETTTRSVYALGARTLAAVESNQWTSDNNMTGDGWGATLRLSHDLGPLRVGAYASYQTFDTRLRRGTYVDLGLSAGRTFKLSKWMTAWISLSLGQRQWQGSPPEGEIESTSFMLSIGTTFR